MSEETDRLNYKRMVGSIPIPSQLERYREPANAHVWDWIVARRPWTLLSIMKNPVAGIRLGRKLASD